MSENLVIGTQVESGNPAVLNARRFNRHTFWCGQSGSGKTYALGVVLERILVETKVPIIVLDPNSDFVNLPQVLDGAAEAEVLTLAQRDIAVLHSVPGRGENLAVRFLDMDIRSRAAILQLDPVLDAEEFNTMLSIGAQDVSALNQPLVSWLRGFPDQRYHAIARRIENLGIADWNLWAWGKKDVTDVLNERHDATVVDLGSFASPAQMQSAALAVLDHLWANREQRFGRIIVIDEAHNLCSPDPITPLERLLTDRIIQIAAEGRKYGIWLLLSTQRPSKVHPNVISQCDNLGLMKMSSTRDLAELAQIFGFAPEELVFRSKEFRQGQALFAGGFSSEPQIVQMGQRLTREGGVDVPIELR